MRFGKQLAGATTGRKPSSTPAASIAALRLAMSRAMTSPPV
jgi:hypothetical protein